MEKVDCFATQKPKTQPRRDIQQALKNEKGRQEFYKNNLSVTKEQ